MSGNNRFRLRPPADCDNRRLGLLLLRLPGLGRRRVGRATGFHIRLDLHCSSPCLWMGPRTIRVFRRGRPRGPLPDHAKVRQSLSRLFSEFLGPLPIPRRRVSDPRFLAPLTLPPWSRSPRWLAVFGRRHRCADPGRRPSTIMNQRAISFRGALGDHPCRTLLRTRSSRPPAGVRV